MKFLIVTGLLLCSLGVFQGTVGQNSPWTEIAPADDFFRLSMPSQAIRQNQKTLFGKISVNGQWYSSAANGASYAIWSLVNTNYQSSQGADEYLDACADLIWEGLLKPARDKLPDDRRARAAMTYTRELPAKPLGGREYSVTVGELTGKTQFYIAGARIYVLLALNSPGGTETSERFFQSFTISPNLPVPNPLYGDPIGSGNRAANSDPTDYNRVLTGREVTQKVRITDKPEPSYTESARKFRVQGTVILRAVFSRTGEVTNLYVVRKLPHGLTEMAMKAARAIKFSVAVKDGQPVSMYIELQYNFNLY